MFNSSLVFPYDMSNISILLHKNKFNYKTDYVLSPSAWGYCSKDAGYILGVRTDKIVYSEKNFDSILEKVDIVVLLDSAIPFDETEFFLYAIKSLEKHKSVICLRKINENYNKILKEASKFYGVEFLYDWQHNIPNFVSSNYKLISPKIPIISINGVAQNTGKFETLLSLKESFEKIGYSPLCISGRLYGEFFGIYSYPIFMFDDKTSVQDKIIKLNYYINELCYSNNFEFILFEVPGGVFPVSDKVYENFSFQNFLINNAICFDLSIINLLYENYNSNYFDWLKSNLNNKYSYNVFAYIVSNNMIHWDAVSMEREASYITIESEFINNWIRSSKVPHNMCGVFDRERFDMLAKKLIAYLSDDENFDII